MKYFVKSIAVFAVLATVVTGGAIAQQAPVLTASVDSYTPASQTLSTGAQNIDVARIKVSASNGDVYLSGIYVGADAVGGLQNFSDIQIYDTNDNSLLGSYPNQSANPDLIQFSPIAIGNGMAKTYLVRASLSSTAAGTARVGFSGFTFATQAEPSVAGLPVYGSVMTLPGVLPTPTPSVSAVPTPTPTPTPTPAVVASEISAEAVEELNSLKDGDIVRADGNTAVFVIKIVGEKKFKRWIISPAVLGAYGIPFSRIRLIRQDTASQFPTSFLMRRLGDEKIYELWDIEEGVTGSRRWIPTVGDFVGKGFDFSAVYTINDSEYNLYTEGQPLRAPIQ